MSKEDMTESVVDVPLIFQDRLIYPIVQLAMHAGLTAQARLGARYATQCRLHRHVVHTAQDSDPNIHDDFASRCPDSDDRASVGIGLPWINCGGVVFNPSQDVIET